MPRSHPAICGARFFRSMLSPGAVRTGKDGGALFTPRRIASFIVVLVMVAALPVRAAGPIGLTSTGAIPRWDSSAPVEYWSDRGTLGTRSNAAATQLVEQSFGVWTGLGSVSLNVSRTGQLSYDVTTSNFANYFEKQDSITPVIFDADGSITDAFTGGQKKWVLGFASITSVNDSTGRIAEGIAVFNGYLLDSQSEEACRTVFVHELGHLLGLAHTELNDAYLSDGNPMNNQFIPVMYPILRNGTDASDLAPTPTFDDELSISYLYPRNDFVSGGGNLAGRVLKDGVDLRGANVIVRSVADPDRTALSWPSGMADRNHGIWEAHRLPAGNYHVQVSAIDSDFVGGSSIGGFDPPPQGLATEYYNGLNESGDPFLDDPSEALDLTVSVGTITEGLDVLLNTTVAPIDASAPRSGTLFSARDSLPPVQFVTYVDESARSLEFSVTPADGKSVDIVVRSAYPVAAGSTVGTFVSSHATTVGTGPKTLIITRESDPPLTSGPYYVALINRESSPTSFTFSTTGRSSTSARSSTIASSGSGGGGGCTVVGRHSADRSEGLEFEKFLACGLLILFLRRLRRLHRRTLRGETVSSGPLHPGSQDADT